MIEHNKNADEIGKEVVNSIFERLFGRVSTLTDDEIKAALDPQKIADAKTTLGGTAPKEVMRQLKNQQTILDKDNAELQLRESTVAKAKKELENEVAKMIVK